MWNKKAKRTLNWDASWLPSSVREGFTEAFKEVVCVVVLYQGSFSAEKWRTCRDTSDCRRSWREANGDRCAPRPLDIDRTTWFCIYKFSRIDDHGCYYFIYYCFFFLLWLVLISWSSHLEELFWRTSLTLTISSHELYRSYGKIASGKPIFIRDRFLKKARDT